MVSANEASLLITVSLVPLAIAPIIYGYFLQAVPARTILFFATFLLAVNQALFFWVDSFWQMLMLRLLQGLLLPGIFTALMTYCSTMSVKERVHQIIAWYVATTILGGFSSRLFAGFIAEQLGWRWVFVFVSVLLIFSLFLLRYIKADAVLDFSRLDIRSIRRVWSDRYYRHAYLALFFVFFVFAGMLNLLPFRLTDIAADMGSFEISLYYLGYLIGIPIAVFSQKITRLLGGPKRALLMGLALNIVGLVFNVSENLALLWLTMLGFSAGMFFIHATLSGLLNVHAKEHKGVVNGMYVSIYYASGALGSWLPALFYLRFDWQSLMMASVLMVLVSGYFVALMNRRSGC